MSLLEREAQHLLDHDPKAHPLVTQEPAGKLGVEQRGGPQADLGQAGQVLVGGMQDPLGSTDGVLDAGQVGHRDRVDEVGSGSVAADLDQIGPLAVPVP